MRWIREHFKTLVLAIAVVILMAVVGFSSAKPGEVSSVGETVNGAVAVAGKPLSDAGKGMGSFLGGLINIRKNETENAALRQQVADLEAQLAKAKLTEMQYEELKRLYQDLDYQSYDDEYNPVTADVVSVGGNSLFNIFTVNVGKEAGIKKDDMVINADGFVGRITDLGEKWSKVTGIVDSSISVSFVTIRNPEILGVISGDGNGTLGGYLFNEDDDIRKGDILVTSGMGIYPAGVRLGIVKTVKINENTKVKEITAESSVDYHHLRQVTVLVKE